MNKIVFSEASITDLEEIKKYITDELCNEKAALNTVNAIMKSIRRLENFANIGSLLSEYVKFNTDFRYLTCGNYMVFYKHIDNEVYIVRILYGKRNYLNILFNIEN